MHADPIDFQGRQRENKWETCRGQPKLLHTHHTVDALHLCLNECHTVLQPVLGECNRKNNQIIRIATGEAMENWLRDVYEKEYGYKELGNPFSF
jgi:hypothetical protein